MRVYIKVTNELRKELQKRFGKTRRSVYNALAYITTGETPNEIREYALAHGGVYEEEDFVPNCEIRFEGDRMIQTFPCGVIVTFDKDSRHCVVTHNGTEIEHYDSVPFLGWGGVLANAQEYSNRLVKASARM